MKGETASTCKVNRDAHYERETIWKGLGNTALTSLPSDLLCRKV